jgi:hypothetical protein
MDGEKHVENFTEADFAGIKSHAHYFNMSGVAIAHLPIGGIIDVASHITGLDRTDALHAVKYRFQAPETSAGQNYGL